MMTGDVIYSTTQPYTTNLSNLMTSFSYGPPHRKSFDYNKVQQAKKEMTHMRGERVRKSPAAGITFWGEIHQP